MISARYCAMLLAMGLLVGLTGCRSPSQEIPMTAQPLDLQAQLAGALAEGRHSLTIPPGRYSLTSGVTIARASGFTLEGTGVTLLFPPDSGMLTVVACSNVTIRGLTIDCDPLPFTQATITRLAPDHRTVEFEVHAGYPLLADLTRRSGIFAFDPATLRWRREVPDLYPSTFEVLSPTRGRFTLSVELPGYAKMRVGDFIAFKYPRANAFFFRNCDGVTMQDVTVLTAPAGGFLLRCCTGPLTFTDCVIKRGPTPAGATHARLLSSVADGFNVGYSRQGPTLERCDFSDMGDDSVNLHGTIVEVAAAVDARTFWVGRANYPEFAVCARPGDPVRFLDPQSYGIVQTGTIAACAITKPDAELEQALRKSFKIAPGKPVYAVRVTLTEPVPFAVGMKLDLPAIACPNFVFRNNYFHDHRARGLRLGASHGIIESNRFERIKSNAISLGPHAVHGEGGWVSDVIVRGNTIRDVCFDDRSLAPDAYNTGAIVVQHFLPGTRAPYPQGNTDIRILDNTIDEVGGCGILATSAARLTIRGNRISRDHTTDCSRVGEPLRLKTGGAISLNYCTEVDIGDNTFGDHGPSRLSEVEHNPGNKSAE